MKKCNPGKKIGFSKMRSWTPLWAYALENRWKHSSFFFPLQFFLRTAFYSSWVPLSLILLLYFIGVKAVAFILIISIHCGSVAQAWLNIYLTWYLAFVRLMHLPEKFSVLPDKRTLYINLYEFLVGILNWTSNLIPFTKLHNWYEVNKSILDILV